MSTNYDGPQMAQKIMRQQVEIERLRRELAEARELLRQARDCVPGNHKFMLRRIDAFLAAAKEGER